MCGGMHSAMIFLLARNSCRGEQLNIKGKYSLSGHSFINQGVAETDWAWAVQSRGVENESRKGDMQQLQRESLNWENAMGNHQRYRKGSYS